MYHTRIGRNTLLWLPFPQKSLVSEEEDLILPPTPVRSTFRVLNEDVSKALVSAHFRRIHAYMCMYMHTYRHVQVRTMCKYEHSYVHIYTRTCANTHAYMCMYMHTYRHVQVRTFICTYIHTYMCKYTCIHICTCVIDKVPLEKLYIRYSFSRGTSAIMWYVAWVHLLVEQ